MKPPFYKTFTSASRVGFVKTIFVVVITVLKSLSSYLRHVPESAVVEVNGSKMLIFPSKSGIHSDLFLYRKREPICTEYLLKSGVINNGDTVLDIGANIGYYVLVESKQVGDSGKIYAVEPVLSNYRLLKKNVELNGLTNVFVYQQAIGELNRTGEIYVTEQANLCSMKKSIYGDKIVDNQEVLVENIDTFLKDKEVPKLIRMDVEGFEYEIIAGMKNTLKEDVMLLIELHYLFLSEKMDELLQILEENNFKVRFAVFEHKVEENRIMKSLVNNSRGDRLPVFISHTSVHDLKNLITKYPDIAPNVFFQK